MNKTIGHLLPASLMLAAAPVFAAGFVTLPATGVPVTGGKSAYVTCNLTGNFGSDPNGSIPPTFGANGANNTCAVAKINPPLAGYTQTANTVRNIVMNNTYTLNQPVVVGTVTDRVWRSGTSCIYGAKIRLNNVDYDRRAASPGRQYFEVNDFLRAGFKGRTKPLAIAYNYTSSGPTQSDDVLYRAGLTFTSVAHQSGDPARPLVGTAPLSQNWVDFTTDINYQDDDGSSVRDSSWLLVRSDCTAAASSPVANILRLRQTGQEGQPWIEISVEGYAPAGATTAP